MTLGVRGRDVPSSFRSGTLWNMGAFGVLAATGIAINVFIGAQAGPAALGVFNQTYAVFVLASQFTVLGLHQSALTRTSQDDDPVVRRTLAVAALGLALLTGALGATVVLAASGGIGALLSSPDVGAAVAVAAPGLLFMTLNKVLLGLANGRRDMRAFAIGQATRYLMMLAVTLSWWATEAPPAAIGLIFTLPEAVLFLVFGAWSLRRIGAGPLHALRPWLRRHIDFAVKGALGGVLLELNARVDVLMLGLFLGDTQVGLYSLAATLAEGFLNVLIVVRNQVNPMLARHLVRHEVADIQAMVRRFMLPVAAGAIGLAACVLAGYPVLVWLLMSGHGYDAAWLPLAILLAGLSFYSVILPFDMIFMQAGRPAWQSIQVATIVAMNIVLNATLIPLFGMVGAAAATAASLVFGALVVPLLCRRVLGFPLLVIGRRPA